jgi:hypothetical protein
MHPSRGRRTTIGRLLILNAILAVVLGVPRLRTATEFKVAACVAAMFPILVCTPIAADCLFGIRCPGCSRRTLRRLATSSSHFRCLACGGRFKRSPFGPWRDASGPEDAAKYLRKPRIWAGFSPPIEPGDSTTGRLLRSKRLRARDEADSRRA